MPTPTCSKCFDCIVPDPHVCIHTCVSVSAYVGGGEFDSPAPTTDEELRDKYCDLRRADDPADPSRATDWCERMACFISGGAVFPEWSLAGDTTRPSDGADPPLEP